jgi:HSP20 family protein
MALMRWDPFAELDALHNQLNSLFNDTFSQTQGLQVAPVTDVYKEGDNQMVVEVHLPNFAEDEVGIDVHNHALEIKAQHHEKEEDKNKKNYLVRELKPSLPKAY